MYSRRAVLGWRIVLARLGYYFLLCRNLSASAPVAPELNPSPGEPFSPWSKNWTETYPALPEAQLEPLLLSTAVASGVCHPIPGFVGCVFKSHLEISTQVFCLLLLADLLYLLKTFIYFIWLCWVLVVTCEISIGSCRVFHCSEWAPLSCCARAELFHSMWDLSSPTRDWTSVPLHCKVDS